jgi:hypothetical protein
VFDNELVMTSRGPASELMALLDVQFDECAPTRVSGSIAADERHHQPWGIVHGGLYTTAIETFATVGAPTSCARIEAGASGSSPSPSTKAAPSSSGRSTSAAPTTTSSSRAAKCVCRTSRRDHERLRDDRQETFGQPRSPTITWHDPLAAVAAGMSG